MAFFRGLSADTKILFGALLLIALLSGLTVLTMSPPDAPPLSIRSDNADGAMVLYRWLQRSGYPVQELLSLEQQLASVNVLFVLDPIVGYSDADIQLIRDWVRKGNTLVVAGSPFTVNDLLESYQVSLVSGFMETDALAASTLTLLHPPFERAAVEAGYRVRTKRPDAVPHLFISNHPVLVSLAEGEGVVWVSGVPVPFTNRGIQDEGNAKIIANLLKNMPSNAAIGFDEAAHGYGEKVALDFNGWLFATPPGWGILLGVTITMIYLALRGRHFGRPIPLPDDRLHRESGEYIRAIARLFRRSGQRAEMLKHYEGQLRRRLSERYALDPNLEPNEIIKAVIYHNPALDEADLRRLLTGLRRGNVSESELVRTVMDVDLFLKQIQ
ncbi:MAG: DUF4350 domain-containing protein [Anaerolineaceae bacterium]|nr:DUF4350 domain-containing protein [Anaerolineaceae bacterium]